MPSATGRCRRRSRDARRRSLSSPKDILIKPNQVGPNPFGRPGLVFSWTAGWCFFFFNHKRGGEAPLARRGGDERLKINKINKPRKHFNNVPRHNPTIVPYTLNPQLNQTLTFRRRCSKDSYFLHFQSVHF